MSVVLNVLQQQFFVRLAVQPTLARIDPRLADVPVEPPGEQQPHAPPASYISSSIRPSRRFRWLRRVRVVG